MSYLLVTDKWDTYAKSDERGVEFAALDLLRERVKDNFWYYDDAADTAQRIVNENNADAALRFLLSRCDAEYEYVEIKKSRNEQ